MTTHCRYPVKFKAPRATLEDMFCPRFNCAAESGITGCVADRGFGTGDRAQAKEPLASQPNLRFLVRELVTFGTGMQAAEAEDAEKAVDESAQFDAELWQITQQIKDGQMTAMVRPKASTPTKESNAPERPKKIPVMSDAYIEPLLSTLSVMSLELRGSTLEAQKQPAEAKAVFERAAREEKALGYHEPPLYIRPVGETEAAALFAAGDFAGAKAAYQQALLDRPRSGFPLYGIALCSEKQSDLAAAKEYSDFLAAWKNADSNLAQISHARTYVAEHPTSEHAVSNGSWRAGRKENSLP